MLWYKQAQSKDTMLQLVVFSVEGEKAQFEDEFQNRFKSCGSMGYRLSFSIDFASVNDSGTYYCAKIHIDSDAEEAEHKSLCTESDLMAGEILPLLSLGMVSWPLPTALRPGVPAESVWESMGSTIIFLTPSQDAAFSLFL